MKGFNVTTKKVYDGGKKQQWPQVGTLTHFPAADGKLESFILELSMFPDTKFYLLPQEPPEPGSRG
jgi:hypothetical protein